MNSDDYKEAIFYSASIFNERLGAEFSEDNLVLRCFQTENQQEVFEQFCKQYFPDRLEDRYTEDGYFDFHASAFVGTGDGADGILLRTDIARHPAELKHILLHELAHIFCTRNEIDGDNFFERYCMDDTISREEDGTINAGYAVWRELIAELIAFELDDNCDVVPLRRKKDLLSYYEGELLTGKNIDDVADALIRAVRDDLAEMPEYAHCETAAYAPEPVQEHRRVRRYQYEMMGVVYPQYAEKNILIDYGVIEEAE